MVAVPEIPAVRSFSHAVLAPQATAMNERSSRSHAIFTLRFTQTTVLAHGAGATDKHSRVDMVDLAGSERVSKSKAAGQRLLEVSQRGGSLPQPLAERLSHCGVGWQHQSQPSHAGECDHCIGGCQ